VLLTRGTVASAGPCRGGCPCDVDTRVRFLCSDEWAKHRQPPRPHSGTAPGGLARSLLAERHDGIDQCGSPRGTIRRDTANRKKQ